MTLNRTEKNSQRLGEARKQDDEVFRVLGVAMVVDQRGVGARMIARYPIAPPPRSTKGDPEMNEMPKDDLFFNLTPRQMAKLFRTKKSLCGRPMTLAVNGTVFCSHATLMDVEENGDEINADKKNQLVLFSVIVALSSPVSHTSVPFSSWLDGATEDQLDLQRYLKEATATAGSVHPGHVKQATKGSVSSNFLAIRRVHISLARYCRVLEREEHRCQYVSLQADRLFGIRNERQKKWEEQKAVAGSSTSKQVVGTSNASVISTMSTQNTDRRERRHRRTGSFAGVGDENLSNIKDQSEEITAEVEQEREQEVLELMMAAPPPPTDSRSVRHRGNLVRELVQFFHSLSRNDLQYPPTPTALLCERDSVVYVNQHIAIPVEAASLKASQTNNGLRPYNTLLFPHASPSELLHAFQASGSAPPQRLQQVLLTVNPQKPLTEIAVDANLPLFTTIEIASYLVAHGACVTSPVVSRFSRLACLHIDKIPELALEFSQTFTNVNFFRLVSFLTSARTLGEAMLVLTGVENDGVEGETASSSTESEEGAWLRECLAPSGHVRQDLSKVLAFSPEEQSPKATAPTQQPRRWVEELEELLFAMAIWLLSHRVLTQMQDYLVLVDIEGTSTAGDDDGDALFRELLESNFLNGDISIMALSWRLGLDQQKLRSWGLRHDKIRIVSRIPNASDDWDSSD